MNKHPTSSLVAMAEQCVRCGMCLPHCPTYKLSNSEGQSPRGRIALWNNWAKNNDMSPKAQHYIASCLSCGACDNNCPAGVPFTTLHNLGKNLIHDASSINNATNKVLITHHNYLLRFIITIFSSRRLSRITHYLLYFYQKLRLHKLTTLVFSPFPAIRTTIVHAYHLLPNLVWPKKYQSAHHQKLDQGINDAEVIIFTGCMNKLTDHNKLEAILNILQILNVKYYLSQDLHCCGALYKHNGYGQKYLDLKKGNIATVQSLLKIHPNIQCLITLDSGCYSTIRENFATFNNLKTINAEKFILDMLLNHKGLLTKIKSRNKPPQDTIIYYHTPCTQREQLQQPNLNFNLLTSIFDNRLKLIPEGFGCCGAAGSYMLSESKTAESLADKMISDLFAEEPQLTNQIDNKQFVLCSSNIGCQLHLNSLLKTKYKVKVKLVSILELINMAL